MLFRSAALATSGGVALFIIPGVTPPYASSEQAFAGKAPRETIAAGPRDIAAVYSDFCSAKDGKFDLVHLGCPHASLEEMKTYATLLAGKQVAKGVELWVTTSRAVRNEAQAAGIVKTLESAGARIISDTCPISCHFARSASPDPKLEIGRAHV